MTWDLATQYGLYADVYDETGDFENARTLAERSLELWKHLHYEKHLPEAYRFLSVSLQRLSRLMWWQNEHMAAMELAEEAVEIQRAVHGLSAFPNGHPELLGTLHNTSFMCFINGDLAARVAMGRRRSGSGGNGYWRTRILVIGRRLPCCSNLWQPSIVKTAINSPQ